MQRFNKITLRQKLVAIVVTSMLLALVIATTLVTIYLRQSVQDKLVSEMRTLAKITSLRSSAALAFGDKSAMTSNLNALMLQPSIDLACVYTPNEEVFAIANQAHLENICPDASSLIPGIALDSNNLRVLETISVKGRVVGSLLVVANLRRVSEQTHQFVMVSTLATLLSSLVVYFIAVRLTRWVAQPITKLAEVANQIRNLEDYSLRATVTSNDETGELVQNFNEMISKIQHAHICMGDLVEELEERAKLNEAQAEKMSQRHDAIRDFFSGVTHDLRQPLQAIGMYVEVLKRTENSEETGITHTKLQQAVTNLGSLFCELLDVARFEAQVEHLTELEPVELSQVIKRICHEFDIVAKQKGLRLAVHSRECTVLSEPTMLERIIRNLVSNAVRYTEQGGILIGVRLRSDQAWIEVWDSGRGIPEEKRDKIFRQFSQVFEADANKGHGLGLSIVHRLVMALGHTLHVDSIEGKGTLFRLKIPRQLVENKTNIPPPSQTISSQLVSSQIGAMSTSLTVVVIDDDPIALDAIVTLLQSWGMTVISFSTSQAALEWADSSPDAPSLFICDYDLGAGDTGTNLLQQLQDRFGKNVQGFIISGTTDSAELAQIKASEYNMLQKPIKPPKLRAMINYLVTQCE